MSKANENFKKKKIKIEGKNSLLIFYLGKMEEKKRFLGEKNVLGLSVNRS